MSVSLFKNLCECQKKWYSGVEVESLHSTSCKFGKQRQTALLMVGFSRLHLSYLTLGEAFLFVYRGSKEYRWETVLYTLFFFFFLYTPTLLLINKKSFSYFFCCFWLANVCIH